MTKLQQAEMTMMVELTKLLDNNGIAYSILGGTAIGAFREGGFVPWDDDMDITIEELDIEKFLGVIKESRFKLKTKLDSQRLPHIKVYDPEIPIIDKVEESNLFIDVFPAYIPRKFSAKNEKVIDRKVAILSLALMPFSEMKLTEGVFPAFFAKIAGKFIWHRKFLWRSILKYIKNLEIDQNQNDKTVRICYATPYYPNLYVVKFNNIIKKDFEGFKLAVSESFPEDNKHIYGDIFEVPKVSDRKVHDIKLKEKA